MTESMTSDEFLEFQGAKPAKNPERVIQGKRTQSQGKSYEADINAANRVYAELGMARIEQLPVETQPMPRSWLNREGMKRSGIARILSTRAPFDYYGTIGKLGARPMYTLGRAIAMECKSTVRKTRLGIGVKGTLKEHQLRACADAWTRFGTITVIVWCNGDERGILLPDRIVDADQRYRIGSRRSIPWDQFLPFERERIAGGGFIEHWLKPVESFINMQLERHDAKR